MTLALSREALRDMARDPVMAKLYGLTASVVDELRGYRRWSEPEMFERAGLPKSMGAVHARWL